jgi:hypothetical protein
MPHGQPPHKAAKLAQDLLTEHTLDTVDQEHQAAMAQLVVTVVMAPLLADSHETNAVVDIHNVVAALLLLPSPTA